MSAAYERGMKGEIYQEEELREKLLLVEELKALGIRLRSGVPARDLTTVRVGGPIHALYQIPTIEAMQAFMRHCCGVGQEMHKPQVLGAGSNSLFPDKGFFSPLIRLTGDFKSFSELNEGVFQVGGAVGLMRLARAVSEQQMPMQAIIKNARPRSNFVLGRGYSFFSNQSCLEGL